MKKRKSQEQERRVAGMLGHLRVPGSGALGIPGDVEGLWLLSECKHYEGRVITVDLAVLEKITAEAEAEGKSPALFIEMASLKPGIEQDWVLLPLRVVAGLASAAKRSPGRPEQPR